MEKLTQRTYTMSEFVNAVMAAYKQKYKHATCTSVNARYPSDPRCRYRLCVFTDVDNNPDIPAHNVFDGMFDTTDIRDMRDLFNDDSIVSTEWRMKPDEYVTIVRKSPSKEDAE